MPESDAIEAAGAELRFEHYTVLKSGDGTAMELGRGAMGITYKAFDVHLQRPAALKIINARFIGEASARHRFVREARAAANVRHPNVASVFHLGESDGNYFYAMEFVEGETLEKVIRRSGKLESNLALEVTTEVAAGLSAIEKEHLVHRDIKPGNIMVSLEDERLESVKIIDLGLAKRVAEQETISAAENFTGTFGYASPEQFAGIRTDIRSDLYSLGVTLWEMLSGTLPFQGSAAELMYQHQHAALPIEKLQSVPAPITALLEVLLEKDPNRRFQSPGELQQAVTRVREAIGSGSDLTANDLRSIGDQSSEQSTKRRPKRGSLRWLAGSSLCLLVLLAGWFYFFGSERSFLHWPSAAPVPTDKSIAVLPFESLSENKSDTYFADGVQGEILNNLAKIAQLKVISRTSVMQYRADVRRDLRQIANALGVATVLEGTVRRDGNHVRVSTELIDAQNDHTIWADSYDRDLTDIFAIQGEVAQTIASKLAATLSPEERNWIEAKPTENLEAYDLYLRAEELIATSRISTALGSGTEKPLRAAIGFLEQAVRLDPEFTLAYCASVQAHGLLYRFYDPTPERRAWGDAAIDRAMRLQPDLPEVHLAYAIHLYNGYRDYDRARVQLAIAERVLANDPEVFMLEALIDRRQGNFEKAIQEFNKAIARDPRNSASIGDLGTTLVLTRQFAAAEKVYDRLIELLPDQPILKVQKAFNLTFMKTGDGTAFQSAIAALPASMADDRDVLSLRLCFALNDRDWPEANAIILKMKNGEDDGYFAYAAISVPIDCYALLLARLRGEPPDSNSEFVEARQQLSQKVMKSPGSAQLLSQLAVVDALLSNKESAVEEAKRAVEMLPIPKDAIDGPCLVINLAVVYAWVNEPDLAFATLALMTKTPSGICFGQLKREGYWDPLREDPRFEKLLAELAPRE
jgi:serine/threonine protein kinase/Tfp pilus assembly protein PilF